jgi:hypothetical protein
MLRTTTAKVKATRDWWVFSKSLFRWKRIAFSLFVVGALSLMPIRSQAAGLDCPEIGPGSVSNLFSDLQVKLVPSADRLELTNEVNDLINKLQILKPGISYTELTNVIIAAVCPTIASANLTSSEKWERMRLFDTVLQRQLAADVLPPGTLIIANIPLPPAIYRELRSQAAKAGQKSTEFMAAILTRAAGN